MHPRFNSAQIEQLKRDAKRLARSAPLPLSQALDRIAADQGFRNWSLLVKSAPDALVGLPAGAPATLDTRTRHYLHGDQVEDDRTKFYCAQCDLFVERDHFGQHGSEAHERALQSIARWTNGLAENRVKMRRPNDAPNILLQPALAAQAAFEASRSPFHRWLEGQKGRDDIVGDVAGDILSDRSFPRGSRELKVLKDHLEQRGAVPEAVEALDVAWAEFAGRDR